MYKIIFFFSLILLSVTTVSCQNKSANNVLGTWRVSNSDEYKYVFSENAQGMMIPKTGNVILFHYYVDFSKEPIQIDFSYLSERLKERWAPFGIMEFSDDSLIIYFSKSRPQNKDRRFSITLIRTKESKHDKWENYIEQQNATPAVANRDAVINDLQNCATLAQVYFSKSVSLGGGGFTFNGWSIPSWLNSNDNGVYAVSETSSVSITLVGIGKEIGKDGYNRVKVTIIVGKDRIISTTINN